MRLLLALVGGCVLLFVSQIEANNRNEKKFWSDIWKSEDAAPVALDENFDIDDEGSGKLIDTHVDDEDDDEIELGSGKDEGGKVTLPDDDDDDDYDINDIDFGKNTDRPVSTDDEDFYDFYDLYENSGSGDDKIVDTTSSPVNTRPLTPCENLRNSALNVAEYKPECDEMGGFKKQQCTFDIVSKEKHCWCVNPAGIEIQGTRLLYPTTPDCDFGANLTSCVFLLVQHSQGLIGTYRPRCTVEGEFEPMQCHGSECWCVDDVGNEITGSFKALPEMPTCGEVVEEPIVPASTKKPLELPRPDGGYTIKDDSKDKDDNVIVNIEPEIPIDGPEDNQENLEEETNNIDGSFLPTKHNDGGIMGQPGLLAAIIGGSVVLLLVVILLVMFVVYRMRKKDEGSYPLDGNYQNYSYQKAPDKEFYA